MTGWIIFGCILLVLIWLFTRSVTVTGVYDSNPELRVKILCFTLVKVPPDPAKQKRKAEKKAKKQAKAAQKAAKKAAKQSGADRQLPAAQSGDNSGGDTGASDSPESIGDPGDNKAAAAAEKPSGKPGRDAKRGKKKSLLSGISLDMIKDYVLSATPPIKRLFRKIRIRDVYIDWVVGSPDAAATALKYGGICAGIYSAVEWLKFIFDTDIKEINIEADFNAEKDDIFAYGTVKLRISTAVGCAIWLAFRVLKTYSKYNSKKPAHKGRPKTKARPRPGRAGA